MTLNLDLTAADLVRREVLYCVSSLVATLAAGYGCTPGRTLGLAEQAFELAAPLPDYEEAAREAGWKPYPGISGAWCRDGETGPNGEVYMIGASSAQDACEQDDIEPHDREVFEHWIVSDWLADKLTEKGEKVDKDFAGLTVWARTTTGQAISMDWVIEQITADLNKP